MENNRKTTLFDNNPGAKRKTESQTRTKTQEKDSGGGAEIVEDENAERLARINFFIIISIAATAIMFVVGIGLIILRVLGSFNTDAEITAKPLAAGIAIAAVGLVFFVASVVLKSIVDKKMIESYSSKRQKQIIQKFEAKHKAEAAKKGKTTSENELTIEDTKLETKFCPHCKKRIPADSKDFCPKCGKRFDIDPMNK